MTPGQAIRAIRNIVELPKSASVAAVPPAVAALKEEYCRVTSALQECCQRNRLGLGGERCHELVIAEVDRLRSELEMTIRNGVSAHQIAETYSLADQRSEQ